MSQDTEPLMLDVSQAHEFKLACRRAGITNADIKRMCEGNLLGRLLPAIRGNADIVRHNHIIDYSLTFEQMIAAGKFDSINDNITSKNFPISGSGVQNVTFELLHFDRIISVASAEKEIVARGLEVAKIEHLLVFRTKYPYEQRRYSIIALGSLCLLLNRQYYPCLDFNEYGPYLELRPYDSLLGGKYRLLAIHKPV